MTKGKFIVIEGCDGSGKDTNIARLIKELHGSGILFTREPGGTRVGNEIRNLVLNNNSYDMRPTTEFLLFSASRAQHVEDIIAPVLLAGQNIISNRFGLSTLAYQIYGRERLDYLGLAHTIEKMVVGDNNPDMTIFLDTNPKLAVERLRGRIDENNRIDEENISFFQRVRDGYLKEMETIPHKVVNADRPIDEVFADILAIVKEVFSDKVGA